LPNLKDEIIAAIKKLPDDVDVSDVMAELYAIQRAQIMADKPTPPRKLASEPEHRRPGRPRKLV
jgi:hypothetical protein